jgi:hypothetical protein
VHLNKVGSIVMLTYHETSVLFFNIFVWDFIYIMGVVGVSPGLVHQLLAPLPTPHPRPLDNVQKE